MQVLCFMYGQELFGNSVPTLFGSVDRTVDLSQERFHSEYYDPLELRVHCATVLSALALLPIYFFAAVVMNRQIALGCVAAYICTVYLFTFVSISHILAKSKIHQEWWCLSK